MPAQRLIYKGTNIGNWVVSQRMNYRKNLLSDDQIKLLKKLSNWSWEPDKEIWEKGYNYLNSYIEKYKSIPKGNFITEDNFKLGRWVKSQRINFNSKKMSDERIRLLNIIPIWSWDPYADRWEQGYKYLKEYININKKLCPRGFIDKNGFNLGDWAAKQRSNYKNGTLSKERIKKLEKLKPYWKWKLGINQYR